MSKREKNNEQHKFIEDSSSSSPVSQDGNTFTVQQMIKKKKEEIRKSKNNEPGTSNIQNDLKTIIENFGQDKRDSSESPDQDSSYMAPDGHVPRKDQGDVPPHTAESGKESTFPSSPEGDHSCYEGCPCNHTLTGIDSLPAHYIVEAKKKRNEQEPCCLKYRHDHKEMVAPRKDPGYHKSHNPTHGHHCSLNRYTKSQVHIRQLYPIKPWFPKCAWFKKNKKYKYKNMTRYGEAFNNTDSGDTVPQLYKAKVKGDLLCAPNIFKFRAVTGSTGPAFITKNVSSVMNFKEDPKYPSFINYKDQYNRKPSTLFDNTGLKKDERKEPETPGQIVVRNPEIPNLRACLNFDGTEYISISELPHRIDIYCFDHLNTSYFRTTDQPPPLLTDETILKTEEMATRFWAEIFGFIHLFVSFVIAFILQLYKFILYSFVRPLMSGMAQLSADYFIKPLLTIIYNGFTQPVMVFIFNIATSFRDICHPIARGIGYFIKEFSTLLSAVRLVEYNKAMKRPAMKDFSC